MTKKNTSKPKTYFTLIFICAGFGAGLALGPAFGSGSLESAFIGSAIGAAIGFGFDSKRNKEK